MKCFSVDVGIYSTCAYLMIRLILIYAFIVLVLFCHVDVDVDNVQSPQLVISYGPGYSAF